MRFRILTGKDEWDEKSITHSKLYNTWPCTCVYKTLDCFCKCHKLQKTVSKRRKYRFVWKAKFEGDESLKLLYTRAILKKWIRFTEKKAETKNVYYIHSCVSTWFGFIKTGINDYRYNCLQQICFFMVYHDHDDPPWATIRNVFVISREALALHFFYDRDLTI